MSFSYSSSLSAWTPAASGDEAKIRILELQPPAWYLRWLPRFLTYIIPLRASLSWAPLMDNIATTSPGPESQRSDALCPPYKALSYTWGNDTRTQTILVNEKKLAITYSLAFALYHLRKKSEPLRIWIDQICINQEDEKEKSEQVGLMDRLYRNTEETLIWLGPPSDGSDGLMDILNKLGVFSEQFNLLEYFKKDKYHEILDIQAKANPNDAKTIEYHAFCDSILHEFTPIFFDSLIAFYKRPWFFRAWVVQEFSLPQKAVFLCGYKSIRAETLMAVFQIINLTIISKIMDKFPNDRALTTLIETLNDLNTVQPFFTSRQRRKAWDEGRIPGDSLYQILQRVCVEQSVQATQGCDLVYGLLGLANDATKLNIPVDYSEENPQLQAALTYTRTAKAIINSGQVDLLIFAQHMKKDINLPSWVPDWRSEIQRSFAWLRDDTRAPLFRASADQPLELFPDENENERALAMMGYQVDEIEEVGGPWNGGKSSGDGSRLFLEAYIHYLIQVRQMCLLSKARGADIYPSLERQDEAIWRIPVGDIDQDSSANPIRATQLCKQKYDHCFAQIELQLQLAAMTSLDEYKAREAEIAAMGEIESPEMGVQRNIGNSYRMRMKELKNKRPFLSRVGYVGMGPSYMRPGDVVIVLNGASVPFVVRPLTDGMFRFLGECYCDGIMDGEITRTRAKEKIVMI